MTSHERDVSFIADASLPTRSVATAIAVTNVPTVPPRPSILPPMPSINVVAPRASRPMALIASFRTPPFLAKFSMCCAVGPVAVSFMVC